MNSLTFLFLFSKLLLIKSYTIGVDCYTCINDVISTKKFCLPNEDSTFGYCCDLSDTTDFCTQPNKYLCTDLAQSTSMKYFFCPNSQSKCYHTSQETSYYGLSSTKNIYINDLTTSVGGTTLDFGDTDTCGWRIMVSSQYLTNQNLVLSVDKVYNAECFINAGKNVSTATNEVSCYEGSVQTFSADQHVFVIAQGAGAGAYMQFSYRLEDKLNLKAIIGISAGSAAGLIIIAGLVIILIARTCVIRAVKANQEKWHEMAIEMSKIVNNAGTKGGDMMDMTPGMNQMGAAPSSRQVAPSRMGGGMMGNFNNMGGMNSNMMNQMAMMNQMNNMNNMNNMNGMGNNMMGNNMNNMGMMGMNGMGNNMNMRNNMNNNMMGNMY